MTIVLLKLFLYHILADFTLQTNWMIKGKKQGAFINSGSLSHIAVHAVLLFFIIWSENWSGAMITGAVAILVSHYLIDWLKIHFEKKGTQRLFFILDQLAHIIVLITVAWVVAGKPLQPVPQSIINQILLLITALLLVTQVSGVLTSVLLSKWTDPDDGINNSLSSAGKHIGYLERFLIFVFIINSQWAAIGLLLTAKSIFRFSEIEKNRKLAEYFMMGTLISLSLAVVISLTYKALRTQLFIP